MKIEKREEKKTAGMEALDRIERKLDKLQDWILIMMWEDKENSEQFVFEESFDLVVNQIDINLDEIDELRARSRHFTAAQKTEA